MRVVVSVGVEGRFKGWRRPAGDLQHSLCSRAPQQRAVSRAGRAELGRWVEVPKAECYDLLI